MDGLRERLARCYTGVVHDVMRAQGFADFTLPPEITPLDPSTILCGPAFTIEGRIETGADPHETLMAWTGLLSSAKPERVWISQPNDLTVAHMGELSAETLARKGVLGCLIDGAIRDAAFILELGFPCWRRFHTPRDVVGGWLPTAIDAPITIGGVLVAPDDHLLGDRDGVIRIPAEAAESVVEAAEHAMTLENRVRTAILDGTDPQQAYLRHRKF